jgi:hypothetical protein
MTRRSLQSTCRDCGKTLAVQPWEERPLRCEPCFDGYLRDIDLEFLASYGQLGVMSRRTVAETCLRALVVESPPARKVLAMAIVEQFLLASADLIGLHAAIRDRERQSIARSFLSFRLDADACADFFAELRDAEEADLLAALGLPVPEMAGFTYPTLDYEEERELSNALVSLVRDLRTTAQRPEHAGLLAELAGQEMSARGSLGPSLAEASWLTDDLQPHQVASLALDEGRRRLLVRAVPVDEQRLAEVVDAIDCMTRAASNLIYAYLTVQDEEARLGALTKEGPRGG